MHENQDFVMSVNMFTPFARTLFSWAAQHVLIKPHELETGKRQSP